MSETPHDPESLADELDRLLSSEPGELPTSFDDPLIETAIRLSTAPLPRLSPEASARIHAAMLAAQAAPQAASGTGMGRLVRRASFTWVSFAATLLLFVVGVIFAAQIGHRLIQPSPTLALPSVTSISLTEAPPSAIPEVETTVAPTQPSVVITATELPQVTSTTPPTVEATLPVTVIIEGPIQTIDGSTIMIFDLTVALNPADPVLSVIQVGDLLRIEGDIAAGSEIITAVRVTVIDADVNVNPADGEVWRDSGDCSNPPPPWAPANGWRRRCEGGTSPGNSGGQGMGMGDDDD